MFVWPTVVKSSFGRSCLAGSGGSQLSKELLHVCRRGRRVECCSRGLQHAGACAVEGSCCKAAKLHRNDVWMVVGCRLGAAPLSECGSHRDTGSQDNEGTLLIIIIDVNILSYFNFNLKFQRIDVDPAYRMFQKCRRGNFRTFRVDALVNVELVFDIQAGFT